MAKQKGEKPDESYSPEVEQMMAEAARCLNCNHPLKYRHRHGGRRNRGYCCLACFYAKPPKMAYAERKWGKPIRILLVELLNQHTAEATAGLLGVAKYTLYQWIKAQGLRRVTRWEASA